jgi:hypothetical protein
MIGMIALDCGTIARCGAIDIGRCVPGAFLARGFVMVEKVKSRPGRRPRPVILDREQAVYEPNLPRWLQEHECEYAVVKGDEILGFFASRDKSLDAGYARYGIVPLLVEQVMPSEPIYQIPNVSSDAPAPRPDRIGRSCRRTRHVDRPFRGALPCRIPHTHLSWLAGRRIVHRQLTLTASDTPAWDRSPCVFELAYESSGSGCPRSCKSAG